MRDENFVSVFQNQMLSVEQIRKLCEDFHYFSIKTYVVGTH